MKSLWLSVIPLIFASTTVMAQEQPPPTQEGRGGFMEACGADIQQFCSSAQTREDRHACIEANRDKFSQACQSLLASHMHGHHHGGNGTQPTGGQD